MSYLVLARKYRPQTFDEVIGQEHVSRTLRNALAAGRVAHAFLFAGVRGVGKTTMARILAKALNCERGPTSTPCGQCSHCREIAESRAVDVYEIDGASHTGVDHVREINENVRYRPAAGRYKIYIIDEVHMLSTAAFNALLKTLEEPPPHVKFVFATTEPHKVPQTILSRCQRYDFKRIPLQELVTHLRQVLASEGVRIADAALFSVAREAEGSVRDAQSLLDQLIVYAGTEIAEGDVIDVLGVADRQVLFELASALLAGQAARCLELVEQLYDHGYDVRRFARDLVVHLRNLVIAKLSPDRSSLPDLPDQEVATVREQAVRRSLEDLERLFRLAQEADEELARSPYPRLVLEMALVRMATEPPLLPFEEIMGRLEQLERRLGQAPERPGNAGAGGGCSPEKAESSGGGPEGTKHGEGATWQQFLDFVRREKVSLFVQLANSQLLELSDRALRIGVGKNAIFRELTRREILGVLRALAGRFFKRDLEVVVAPVEGLPPPPSAPPEDDAVVEAAVKIFGGEVRRGPARSGQAGSGGKRNKK